MIAYLTCLHPYSVLEIEYPTVVRYSLIAVRTHPPLLRSVSLVSFTLGFSANRCIETILQHVSESLARSLASPQVRANIDYNAHLVPHSMIIQHAPKNTRTGLLSLRVFGSSVMLQHVT